MVITLTPYPSLRSRSTLSGRSSHCAASWQRTYAMKERLRTLLAFARYERSETDAVN
jgi:hypothetical protein